MKKDESGGDKSDEFRLEEFLPYRLSVASGRISRLFARVFEEKFGLSIPEWRTLTSVGRFGALSPSQIAERTAMDKVKVSRAASSLTNRGLVRQSKDATDGRSKRLRLTRKGVATCRDIVAAALETEATIAAGVSRTEWVTLNRILAKLDAHATTLEKQDGKS